MAQTIHFHSSDDRFCGSTEQCRQFTVNDDDVTCPACRGINPLQKFGLVCAQGTLCVETILYGHEYTPEWRARIEAQFCTGRETAPIAGTWCDVTEGVDDLIRQGYCDGELAHPTA